MAKIINRRLYDFPAGGYCGVFMPEKVMKRIAKVNARHSAEIRKILDDSKDDLYPSHWTLANKMDGDEIAKQITVRFTLENFTTADVENRISLFNPPQPVYYPEVCMVKNYDEAKQVAESKLAEEMEGVE